MWFPTSFFVSSTKKQSLHGGAGSQQQENRQSLLHHSWFIVLVLILLGATVRLSVLFLEIGWQDADEAVFGLLAKQVLHGESYPIYMPGAHYAGTMVVYLAAGLFSIFGPSVVTLKLSTYPFALGFVVGTFELGRRLGGIFIGALAGFFVAVAPPLLVRYSQLAIGGHTETLALGVWLVILTMELERRRSGPNTLRLTFLTGFLAGIAFWTLPAIVPFLLAIFSYIALQKPLWWNRRSAALIALAATIGAFPFILYTAHHPTGQLFRFGSMITGLERTDITYNLFNEPLDTLRSWIAPALFALPRRLWQLLKNSGELFWLFQTSSMLHLFVSGLTSCIGVFTLAAFIRDHFVVYREQGGLRGLCELFTRLNLLALVGLWTLLFLLGTGLHRPRHLLLLFSFMPVALAFGIERLTMRRTFGHPVAIMIVVVIVLNSMYGIASSIPVDKPTLPRIIETLDGQGLTRGYAGYDLAYPIIFRSGERIIVSPLAGPKRVDRLPKYSSIVENSPTVFYLFPTKSRELDAFVKELLQRSISFKRINLSTLTIFYEFSRMVKPAELKLLNSLPGL